MLAFDTPEPISVRVELSAGDVWIKASDRTDTVVEVRPSNSSSKSDASAVEQTRVEFAGGRLLIKAPKSWRRYSFFSAGPSVDIMIELPSGSRVQAEAEWAAFRCEGRLGDCSVHTARDVRFDLTGALDVDTSAGDVTVERAAGHASIVTASGTVRLRAVDGTAVIKNSSGACWVGEVTGALRVHTASGDITIDRAMAAVTARTAYGAIRIGEIMRGSTDLQTSYGDIDVGIRAGTAAWLDLRSPYGQVHNVLEVTSAPAQGDETAEIRALASYGDIIIRRS